MKGKIFFVSVSPSPTYLEMKAFVFENTRKNPLRGYIIGVLTHTAALDRLLGGDETLTMWF